MKSKSGFTMAVLGILVGIVAGLGAIFFRGLIAVFHNFFFLGKFSIHYDTNLHTPASPWEWGVIFVPVLGAVMVAWLVKTWAPEAKGHGVPEVMDAIHYNEGKIRPIVAVIKSIASALSIGTGGSVGREGPIIQIGATFGSTVGSWIRMPALQRSTLIAAGAGGGIAATFNCPLAGVAFAVELMLPIVRASTLMPVILSTAIATHIGRMAFGMHPSFVVPELAIPAHAAMNPWVFPLLIIFGILMGIAAVLFIRGLYWSEDLFNRIPGNYYSRHMLGMLFVGIEMYLFLKFFGHYFVQGVGYATIMDVLTGVLTNPWFLLLIFGAKLCATFFTLGSGASGGIFSPGLYMGAALGAAFGVICQKLIPGLPISPVVFAVAGMAAMIGGTTGAAVTASVMIFEQTRDYSAILPILITVAISYAIRNALCKSSIYTLKLERRGHIIPGVLKAVRNSEIDRT